MPDTLRREAADRDVDPARLVFSKPKPLPEHVARLSVADLYVDTLPVNGHTTVSDCLWAGLPVLTCSGETFAGRVAGSLLRAIGCEELVTEDLASYADLALELATHPLALAAVRKKLTANRLTTPLFDSERFTRALETAYDTMMDRLTHGLPPAAFDVPP